MGLGSVIGIGWRAAGILGEGGVDVRVLAALRTSIYMVADGEILWLGGPTDLMHGRAVLLSESPDGAACVAGDTLSLPPWVARPWRPSIPMAEPRAAPLLRRGAQRLAALAGSLGEPQGFGEWLVGKPLAFPLTGAAKAADALASACARDDAAAAGQASMALIGLGGGLTPSGDDFVGGAFFARAVLAQLGGANSAAWQQAATLVRTAASSRTNAISAALLGDLLEGHGWSPLHDVACALASDDSAVAMNAAARLARLGHSSGWDVLAGFIASLAR
jgi:hypothetical protein